MQRRVISTGARLMAVDKNRHTHTQGEEQRLSGQEASFERIRKPIVATSQSAPVSRQVPSTNIIAENIIAEIID